MQYSELHGGAYEAVDALLLEEVVHVGAAAEDVLHAGEGRYAVGEAVGGAYVERVGVEQVIFARLGTDGGEPPGVERTAGAKFERCVDGERRDGSN